MSWRRSAGPRGTSPFSSSLARTKRSMSVRAQFARAGSGTAGDARGRNDQKSRSAAVTSRRGVAAGAPESAEAAARRHRLRPRRAHPDPLDQRLHVPRRQGVGVAGHLLALDLVADGPDEQAAVGVAGNYRGTRVASRQQRFPGVDAQPARLEARVARVAVVRPVRTRASKKSVGVCAPAGAGEQSAVRAISVAGRKPDPPSPGAKLADGPRRDRSGRTPRFCHSTASRAGAKSARATGCMADS